MKAYLLAAVALLAGMAPAAPDSRGLFVKAGLVLPVEGNPIPMGAVLCRDGKIVAVGPASSIDAGDAEILDLGPRAVIVPGLVAVSSGLAAPGAGAPESVAPAVRALDGFDWFKPQRRALEGGVTTVYLDAGRRRVLGGQGAVVKTAGASPESRTLVARAGLYGAVGDPARNPPALFDAPSSPDPVAHPLLPLRPQSPGSRMAGVAMLREALERGRGAAGSADPGLAALEAVAAGREPLRLRAEEAADLVAAAALAKETGARVVVAGARDAGLVLDDLAAAGVSVALESPFVPGRVDDPSDPADAERRAEAMGNPAALLARGIPFALGAADAALGDLALVAGAHVGPGFPADRALRSVTLDAARILGVDARVGSLVPGKDADLAAFSGDPFLARSMPILTVVDGSVAWRREPRRDVVVLRARAVHTGTGAVFAPGAVAFEGGKVIEAGAEVGIPPEATVLERPDAVVVPGFVDAHTRLGLRGAGGDSAGNLPMSVPLAQALVPDHPSFAAALGAGVTTALVTPGGRGPVVGPTAVVKTAGGTMEERTLRSMAGVEVSLAGAGNLPAALQELRDALDQAKKHHEAWEKYDKDVKEYAKAKKEFENARKKREEEEKRPKDAKPPVEEKKEEPKKEEAKKDDAKEEEPKKDEPKKDEPKKDEGKKGEPVEPKEPMKPGVNAVLEAWRDLFRKKMPIFCRVASAAEATGAVKVVKEEGKLDLVLVQADEAWRVAPALRKADVPVILGPRVTFAVEGRTVNAARALFGAGVPFGFGSDGGFGSRDLPRLAGHAVRNGLGTAAAIRALTLDAARILRVDDRVGSLETGKDADLLILSGDPFELDTRVRAVLVGGKAVVGEP